MGFPKALLGIGKKTLLFDQIRRLKKAGCKPIIIVAGANAEAILSPVQNLFIHTVDTGRLCFVLNKSWPLGQFSSIKRGLKILQKRSNGCLLLPVDCPFVSVSVIKRIIKTARNCQKEAVIPVYVDRSICNKGHPIWISRQLIKEILKTDSKKGRLDKIISANKNIYLLKTRSKAILNNINTIKDWKKLKKKSF